MRLTVKLFSRYYCTKLLFLLVLDIILLPIANILSPFAWCCSISRSISSLFSLSFSVIVFYVFY